MPDLALQNVSKSFRVAKGQSISAIHDFSLEIREGEFISILGPSGSGKTTLLRLIAGLEEADAGTITMGGRVINAVPAGERNVAMVFQSSALYPHMTVGQNLGFPLRLRKQPKAEIARAVREAADALGIAALLERKPETLSGGERQRVALGRALVQRPDIFLFDEPLSNVDAAFRLELRRQISELHRRLKTTMIYVTHDQVEALTLGERVAVLRQGGLEQIGNPAGIYDRPDTRFVAEFIGSPGLNLFPGRISREGKTLLFAGQQNEGVSPLKVQLEGEQLQNQNSENRRVLLGIRPEHLEIVPANAGDPTALVDLVERTGPLTIVHMHLGTDRLAAAMKPNALWRTGQTVSVRFDMTHAHFFDLKTGRRIG